MKILFLIISLLAGLPLQSQTLITGTVTDVRGERVAGVNIYLKDSYDGISSDTTGHFAFHTVETGHQLLIASAVGYHDHEQPVILVQDTLTFSITLKENIAKMNEVLITAGSFEASDEGKAVILKPLDIVTTAGALGGIAAALQTLPGTQTVGEDGRLFIRGGESNETKIFIDGVLSHTPFQAKVPNLPTRGRFSPFLFKGTTFSTGGYSAEYGQALSSALILNTLDFPVQHQTDFSFMSVGVDAAHQHRWDKTSVSVKGEYSNLTPYQWLITPSYQWEKAPEAASGTVVFHRKTSETGLLKGYGNYSHSSLTFYQPNRQQQNQSDVVSLQNNNWYLNTSYQEILNDKWSVKTGIAYTYDDNHLALQQDQLHEKQRGLHVKTVFTLDASERTAIRLGSEYFYHQWERQPSGLAPSEQVLRQEVEDKLAGSFIETDWYLSSHWVSRPGVRVEYNTQTGALTWAPRLSLAYKTGDYGQLSLAYGKFYQTPEVAYLYDHRDLSQEQATHYILHYQRMNAGRTFRVEVFYKDYKHLVKAERQVYNNSGYGYAQGVELFWRDKTSIQNGDFWVSYSYLDTKRNYHEFPASAVPVFASRHNFSVVYKHFITALRIQTGFSYQFASGRPYYNPHHSRFHADRTPAYHNLSLNAAYLIKQNIILYTAFTNVLGTKQVFGYEYSQQPDEQGRYPRRTIGPVAPRFFFVGLFVTLTKDQQENQLDNL